MIVEIDSVDGDVKESSALQDGDVTVCPYGRGQFVTTVRLPDGVTMDRFAAECDALGVDACLASVSKAFRFYSDVVARLKKSYVENR